MVWVGAFEHQLRDTMESDTNILEKIISLSFQKRKKEEEEDNIMYSYGTQRRPREDSAMDNITDHIPLSLKTFYMQSQAVFS